MFRILWWKLYGKEACTRESDAISREYGRITKLWQDAPSIYGLPLPWHVTVDLRLQEIKTNQRYERWKEEWREPEG